MDNQSFCIDPNDLQSEITKLKNLNSAQTTQIEEYKQQIYELKRHLTTSKAMEEHLLLELQDIQTSESNNYTKRISLLEEENSSLKQQKINVIQQYDLEIAEIQKHNEELLEINEQLKTKTNVGVVKNDDDIDKYTDEISDLKTQIEQLANCFTESKFDSDDDLKEKENKIIELANELEETKLCLNAKREELQEVKNLAQNLKDEIIEMTMEMNRLKEVSLKKGVKGNSLFAEVDDNRVKLQKHLKLMNEKYADLKIKFNNQSQEIKKLHSGYAAQKLFQEECLKELSQDQLDLIASYKKHYETLTESVNRLENELQTQKESFSKIMTGNAKSTQEFVAFARKDIIELQKSLKTESVARMLTQENLYETKKDLRKWHSEALRLQQEIIVLKQSNEAMQLKNEIKNEKRNEDQEKQNKKEEEEHNYWKFTFMDSLQNKTAIQMKDDVRMMAETKLKPEEPINRGTNTKPTNIQDNNYNMLHDWTFDEPSVSEILFRSNNNSRSGSILKENSFLNFNESHSEIPLSKTMKFNDKENVLSITETSKNKKVNFSQNTVQKTETTKKRGGKVMTINPIHISSLKKEK